LLFPEVCWNFPGGCVFIDIEEKKGVLNENHYNGENIQNHDVIALFWNDPESQCEYKEQN